MVKVEFITLLQNEVFAKVKIQKFHGHKLKQDHLILGNIPAVF